MPSRAPRCAGIAGLYNQLHHLSVGSCPPPLSSSCSVSPSMLPSRIMHALSTSFFNIHNTLLRSTASYRSINLRAYRQMRLLIRPYAVCSLRSSPLLRSSVAEALSPPPPPAGTVVYALARAGCRGLVPSPASVRIPSTRSDLFDGSHSPRLTSRILAVSNVKALKLSMTRYPPFFTGTPTKENANSTISPILNSAGLKAVCL